MSLIIRVRLEWRCFINKHLDRDSNKPFYFSYWPFKGSASFVDHFSYLCFVFVFVILSCLFLAALWSPAGKGLASWLSGMWFHLVLFDWFDSLRTSQIFFQFWTSTKQGLLCLAQGHNAVAQVRPQPAALWSPAKHSTTEPDVFLCVFSLSMVSFVRCGT